MNDYNENESNWLLYFLIILLGTIIVANIGVDIWQKTLERKYNVRYEEAETLSEEYKDKYYSMDETINSLRIKLEDIISNASKIVKQNIITAIGEMFLALITLIPIFLMHRVFKLNKEIGHFHPNRIMSIILFIEVVISMLTCFMDLMGSIETIEQYQQINGLFNEMFKGLDTILDTINY